MVVDVYEKLANSDSKIFVIVAGNIGCGKTTLTQNLSERLGWRPMFESVKDNPYLDDFYSDMARWSFPLQIYFLTQRFKAHQLIESSNFSAIQDRSIYEDANIFARALHERGKMSTRDYDNYCQLYSLMVQHLGSPTLMVFLKKSVSQLIERIKQRGRSYEKMITADYITRLNYYYEEWYERYDTGKKLVVDTDDLDFLHNGSHFDRLVTKIQDSIDQRDLFY